MKTLSFESVRKNATPGTWMNEYDQSHNRYILRSSMDGAFASLPWWFDDGVTTEAEEAANAALICHSVNAMPELIATLKECAQALDAHIQLAAKEQHVPDDVYCSCMSTTLAKANEVLIRAQKVVVP